MKVLIMAAGVGSRISRHLHGQPKCCVEVNGQPLIRYTLELLQRKGLNDIAIVTGYQEKYIVQALEGLQYRRYYNPFYKVTNSIASAWFAREFLSGDDILIMNGDLFLEEKLIDILIDEKRSPLMLSDSTRIEDADYRFNWSGELLQRYGKELSNEETTGEYVGIGKLSQKDLTLFKQRVLEYVSTDDYSCWWEDVIYREVENQQSIYVNDIAGTFWAEVDFIEDYNRILDYVSTK